MKRIWKPDGTKSMVISDRDYTSLNILKLFSPELVPPDYKARVGIRKIAISEIALEEPPTPENSELRLDF